MIQALPTIFSFFSGAGFLDLGFELSGYKLAFVNELFLPFLDSYRYSRKELKMNLAEYGYHDFSIEEYLKDSKKTRLRELVTDAKKTSSVVGFMGGPPCPDFSIGGKNRGKEGNNGKLSEIFSEIICQQKPDFFVFENVKGLWQTKKHRKFYEEFKQKLSNAGYLITEKLVNSIEYAVPQDRDRVFMIGFLSDLIPNNHLASKNHSLIFPWKKWQKYSKDSVLKSPWPTLDKFEEDSILSCPSLIQEELTVEYWFERNNVLNHPNSKHHFIPRAGLKRFLTIQEGDDSKKSFKRLHRWRYSPTVCYGNNEVHLHPYKARRISAAEAFALQSLPNNYLFPDNMTLTNMFKAIGNGVPYLLSFGIAQSILCFFETIQNESSESIWNSNEITEQKDLQLTLI
jgi:DNA (cytosine-5)-methyltransferase 1